MIGTGLKKLARSHGLSVAHGVAYGNLGGFAATMSEGNNYKQIIFTTKLPNPEKAEQLQLRVNEGNVSRQFRVQTLQILSDRICVVFTDIPGTIGKMEAFLTWFLPLLENADASHYNICSECGCEIIGGCWKLIDGIAYHLHDACAEKIHRELEIQQEERKNNDSGSYFKGALGALIGSFLGSVIWGIVLNFGYVASIIGYLIGVFAEKGYDLLKGKQGKGKVVILIFAVLLGVFVGNFAPDIFYLMQTITNGELPDATFGDIPFIILYIFAGDSEYRASVIANMVSGFIFAGLGVFTLLRQAAKNVSSVKIYNLE